MGAIRRRASLGGLVLVGSLCFGGCTFTTSGIDTSDKFDWESTHKATSILASDELGRLEGLEVLYQQTNQERDEEVKTTYKITADSQVVLWSGLNPFVFVCFCTFLGPSAAYFGILEGEYQTIYLWPPADLVGRLFGDGLGHHVITETMGIGNQPPLGQDLHPILGYFVHLFDWVGWFMPFYPFLLRDFDRMEVERTLLEEYAKEPTGVTKTLVYEEYGEFSFALDDTPLVAILKDGNWFLTDTAGSMEFYEYYGSDTPMNLTVEHIESGVISTVKLLGRDLGISWATPKRLRSNAEKPKEPAMPFGAAP